MDIAKAIVNGLIQIHDLREAIHRQRRVNHRTYLRLMEIFIELRLSESLQANAMLQRTATIEKFAQVVVDFARYLKKYHDMHKVVRIFKVSRMEEKRLKIVDEIDQLFRMLNLATTVTIMNGEAVASRNAEKLFAKLNDMHGDIRFTHDQIHAALLAGKRKVELANMKMLPEREPVLEKNPANRVVVERVLVRQPPMQRNHAPIWVDKISAVKDLPSDVGQEIPMLETRQSSPIAMMEGVRLTDQCVSKDTVDDKMAIEAIECTAGVEGEEKTPADTESASEQEGAGDVVDDNVVAVYKVVLAELKQKTANNAVEKEEQVDQEPLLIEDMGDGAVEEEDETVDLMPLLIENIFHEEVEEIDEQIDHNPAPIENTANTTNEGIKEVEEEKEEREVTEQTPTLEQSTSPLLENFSVPLLIQLLGSGEDTTQSKEDALLQLICKCVTNSNRVQVYKTKGIPVLMDLVRAGESFFTQLYALHCLSWFTFSYSNMRESEFESLRECVREPTHSELLSLLHELQYGDDKVKEVAALQCSCIATRGDVDALRRVGVLPLLIDLLTEGTTNQKLWAAEALVTLASDDDDSCVAITREGGIPPLIALLRSGTDMQKQEAAYALGNLAANNPENRRKIAREGAIPPMVAFVNAVTDAQNQWAVYALGFLSLNNEENRVLIAQEGAIPPLVALLRTGTCAQKQWSAYTLGNLAYTDANRVEITQGGAVAPLIKLLRAGTAMQKQRAAFALGNLACDNNDAAVDLDEAILPLVELVRTGSDTQKEDAAYTLGNLAANNDGRRSEIGRKGAIAPLVNLVTTGNDEQKQWAAFALRWLSCDNDTNRAAILEEGAAAPLTVLVEGGTDQQKKQAAHALRHLVAKNDATANTFLPDRFMTPLMGYLRAGVSVQNKNVAAALSTIESVREGVIPLFHKLVKAGTEAHKQSAEDAKAKIRRVADAW